MFAAPERMQTLPSVLLPAVVLPFCVACVLMRWCVDVHSLLRMMYVIQLVLYFSPLQHPEELQTTEHMNMRLHGQNLLL